MNFRPHPSIPAFGWEGELLLEAKRTPEILLQPGPEGSSIPIMVLSPLNNPPENGLNQTYRRSKNDKCNHWPYKAARRHGIAAILKFFSSMRRLLLFGEFVDDVHQLSIGFPGLPLFSGPQGTGNAVLQVVPYDELPDTSKGFMNCRDLPKDLHTVATLLHHFLNPFDLPFDPAEPLRSLFSRWEYNHPSSAIGHKTPLIYRFIYAYTR